MLPTVATALATLGLTLGLSGPGDTWINGEAWINVPLAIGFSTVAAGIWATRPHPRGLVRLGALYTVCGLAAACVLPMYGLARTDLGMAIAFAWVSNWIWALGAAPLIGLGLVLYPDGRLPGRRWWPVPVIGVAGPSLLAVSQALAPGELGNHPQFDNPLGIGSPAAWVVVGGAGFIAVVVAGLLGVGALVVKYYGADASGDVRPQIRGFLIVGVVLVLVAAIPSRDDPVMTVVVVLAVASLPVTIGFAVVRHRLLDQREGVVALERAVGSLTASRRRIVNEREEERSCLRRELHDGLGPSLAAIGLGLRHLQQHAGPHDEQAVRLLADEVQRAVVEVRRICDGLRPAAIDELGLATALTESLEPLRRFGPSIALSIPQVQTLPPAVEVAAYRIVMEAVTNAVRHSGARCITVCVTDDDELVLQIVDDGAGIDPDHREGVGLQAMTERAAEVGGRLLVTARTPTGTVVEARLPVLTRG